MHYLERVKCFEPSKHLDESRPQLIFCKALASLVIVFDFCKNIAFFCVFHDETKSIGLEIEKRLFVLNYILMSITVGIKL